MTAQDDLERNQRFYSRILAVLLALFCFRVLAQLLQAFFDVPYLPAFDAWQSGALPYRALLLSQVLIIVVFAWILVRFWTGSIRPSRKQGGFFLVFGLLYFGSMALRLYIGLANLSSHYWFHSYLPVFFHFVLSSYLIVVGLFHLRTTDRH